MFEIYQGKNKRWFWRYVSPNGRKMAFPGYGYSRSAGAKRALVRLLVIASEQPRIVVRK